MVFEWDRNKDAENIAKHGIGFTNAIRVFTAPMFVLPDEREDYGEERLVGIGLLDERVVVIVFTEPDEDTIRVISIRKALQHERQLYEKHLRDQLGAD